MRMTVTDEQLALASADGDRSAFSALLARHYDRLFAFAMRMTGDRAEAEDLTQDICMALPGKLAGFRGEAKFTTWLYRVTVNAAHDRRRRAATHAKAAGGWGDWETTRQAANRDEAEARDWLVQAMRALPDELRDTLALTLGEGLSQKETAAVLDVSEGTIAWRVSEAKRRLKAIHAEEEQL